MHSRVTDDNIIMCLEANKQKYISSLLVEVKFLYAHYFYTK